MQNMRLVSPCQPSLMTVMSMLTMSPFFRALSFGMPWQTWWLIEVDDVAVLQLLVARNTMADLMVDRSADRLGVGRITRRCIVQRRRNAALHLDHVVVAEAVEFIGGDAGLHKGLDVVEHFGGESSGEAHAVDFGGGFYRDAHGGRDWGKGRRIPGIPAMRQFVWGSVPERQADIEPPSRIVLESTGFPIALCGRGVRTGTNPEILTSARKGVCRQP
jgi:hypothetical protein